MNGMNPKEMGYSDAANSVAPNSNQALFNRQEYIDGYAQGSIDRDADNSILYEVIIGNIGTVYSGKDGFEAFKRFQIYSGQSKGNYGRATGEDVTLMKNGEIRKEFIGSTSREQTED
jgi:lipoprotein-anchoring transpeptidase ErfK/SrfK